MTCIPAPAGVPRVFYGWFVVAAAFAVTFVGYGCVYSFSAFIGPLQHDFGASRGSVSVVFSLAGFLYFVLGSISGPLADRFGARRLAVIGMLLVGLGLAAVSAAQGLAQVYAAYGLELRGADRRRHRRQPDRGRADGADFPQVRARSPREPVARVAHAAKA